MDDQPRHAADDRQVRNQRRQLRPELVRMLVRQRRERDRAAGRTLPPMTAILRDVRGDRRQLGDLMSPRLADVMPRVQPVRTAATGIRNEIHERIHVLQGHQLAMMSRMPGLTAGLAATLHATTTLTLLTREAIGGRRLRRGGRILLVQRELALEIGNPLRLLIELLAKPFVFVAKPFDFRRVVITPVTPLLCAW